MQLDPLGERTIARPRFYSTFPSVKKNVKALLAEVKKKKKADVYCNVKQLNSNQCQLPPPLPTPQYGTTNPGPACARRTGFGPLPLEDYKFRGDAEDSDKWRFMEETVLNQALAREGFNKMNWLLEKQDPDKEMYEMRMIKGS